MSRCPTICTHIYFFQLFLWVFRSKLSRSKTHEEIESNVQRHELFDVFFFLTSILFVLWNLSLRDAGEYYY